jgi:hypothetical protein
MYLFDDIAAGMAYCFLAHGAPAAPLQSTPAACEMAGCLFGANPLEANPDFQV